MAGRHCTLRRIKDMRLSIEILIDRGADAKKKNLDGKTPADICCYDAVEKAKGKRERLLLIIRGEENA